MIDLGERMKNHVDAFPRKVYGNNLHTTSSCSTIINLKENMNYLIWSSGSTSLSGSNFGKSFSEDLGKGCGAPRMTRESIVSHGEFPAMFPPKLKFDRGDGIEVIGGFVSGGSGGPKPSA